MDGLYEVLSIAGWLEGGAYDYKCIIGEGAWDWCAGVFSGVRVKLLTFYPNDSFELLDAIIDILWRFSMLILFGFYDDDDDGY